ncbi:MAG: IS200/IS605 family transposase [Roseimicrobium sp.]
MPQSLSHIVIHTIFSTKHRVACFQDKPFQQEMHAFLGGCAKSLGCLPIQIGGVSDHVHLLTTLARTVTVAEFVKEVKRVSSNWIQERGGLWSQFHWQAGYACFSVSESNVAQVGQYVAEQERHHATLSFQDEYRAFLRKHGEAWDERYVWD